MGKTAAERQREHRQRHRKRINMPLDPHAKYALARLASHHGVTQKAMLEQIIEQAERATVDNLDAPSTYYDDVTQ